VPEVTFLKRMLARSALVQPVASINGALDAQPQTESPDDDVEVVTSLARLDEILAEIDAAWSISDDAVRAVFATFRMAIDSPNLSDPWSRAYRDAQFDLYHRISSRPMYSTDNEVSAFAVDPKRPFPYYTESFATVGDQLMGIGYLIKAMGLSAGSSILEFGPGWGNTTIALAQMGYEVTAIDIDPNFVQLIQDRAALFALEPDARVGEFLDAGTMTDQFDAVLFYECFHHCSDHVRLLSDLHRVVRPGGQVFLAAEPIFDGFHAPWGLRLDGESLWAIRQNGWLELGFTESYFVETCLRLGWSVSRHVSDVCFLTSIFSLSRLGDEIFPGAIRFPPADESGWAPPDSATSTQRYTLANSRLVCPIDQKWNHVEVNLTNPGPRSIPYVVRHGDSVEHGRIAGQSQAVVHLPYESAAGEIRFETETWRPSEQIAGSDDTRSIGVAVTSVKFR
jgi:2-polyprenyl-3-methyl-5-hydroxy-6-metoxy-1,4-benzoquinol methylase